MSKIYRTRTSRSRRHALVLAKGRHPLAARLTLAVAELVVADDDPNDEIGTLSSVVDTTVPTLPAGLPRVRLECCRADLSVRAGVGPAEAFQALVTRARTGAITDAGHAALALRRAGYALAVSGATDDAVNLFQEAVREASDAHLGGDAHDSLRAVAFLATGIRVIHDATAAAAATGNDKRLLEAGEQAALSTLEHLADDHRHAALAMALFEVRTWLRVERASGAVLGELIAHRRHGQVLYRAGRAAAAVIPFIRAHERDLAAQAAQAAEMWIDVSRFLRDGPPWTRTAACAVAAEEADLVPDDHIDIITIALVELVASADANTAKGALEALGAPGTRLPTDSARRLLIMLTSVIAREPDQARYGDQEALTALAAMASHPDPAIADTAAELLVQALGFRIPGAEVHLGALAPTHLPEIEGLADKGNSMAVVILANWTHRCPAVTAAARAGAERLLDHPLGPREFYNLGSSAPLDAVALRCALQGGASEAEQRPDGGEKARTTTLVELRDRAIRHLMAWAEDHHDRAPSRATALAALHNLRVAVPEGQRGDLHRRLLAIADHPHLHPGDLLDQASTDPLSYVTFHSGSEDLAAAALLVAAAFATTREEAAAVADRLTRALTMGNTDEQDAGWRMQTLRQLERLHPIPLDGLARHPAPHIRVMTALLWGGRPDRNPDLATVLADDGKRSVRRAIASSLIRLDADALARDPYREILARLANDPSAIVRAAAVLAASERPSML